LWPVRAQQVSFLERVDPPAAAEVRQAYACFDRFGDDPQRYGRCAAMARHGEGCRGAAVRALTRVVEKSAAYARVGDGIHTRDAAFSNEMNARVVVDAEKYYRSMFEFNESSWNIRDKHFDDTLYRVRAHMKETRGSDKVVVWAHNSHLGDARATKTGATRPGQNAELNLGQLARESGGAAVVNVGQFTHSGTVTASDDWGEPHKTKQVRPALPGSYEELLHAAAAHANRETYALDLREPAVRAALAPPLSPRLERAIGVIYRPETERQSHYFPAFITRQFDVAVWHDTTRALPPLDAAEPQTPEPETFPSGL
jgi:erythromycin esterase-like protein